LCLFPFQDGSVVEVLLTCSDSNVILADVEDQFSCPLSPIDGEGINSCDSAAKSVMNSTTCEDKSTFLLKTDSQMKSSVLKGKTVSGFKVLLTIMPFLC
jgi:hypothetical protein